MRGLDQEPFPSMGKGRDGVEAPAVTSGRPMGAGADRPLTPQHRASTPTPAPPPSRGREALAPEPLSRFDRDRHAAGAVAKSRHLRANMTLGEKRLWDELRKLKLHIRRQAPIGRYIADFAHHAARVVIEVDSPRHDGAEAELRDAERDAWLDSQGYKVLRFRDEALSAPEQVAEMVGREIETRLGRPKASTPFPSMGKGRDGVEAPAATSGGQLGAGANLPASPQHRASTPTPAPPPSRGRGSRDREA